MDVEGFDSIEEMIEDAESGFRAGYPGICMNPNCDYCIDVEPDQDEGWCELCRTNTVKSFYILLGVL